MHYGNQPVNPVIVGESYTAVPNHINMNQNSTAFSHSLVDGQYAESQMVYTSSNHQNVRHGVNINESTVSNINLIHQNMVHMGDERAPRGLNQISMAQNDMVRQTMLTNQHNSQQKMEFERHRRALEQTVAPMKNQMAESELRLNTSIRPYDTRPRRRGRGRSDYTAQANARSSTQLIGKYKSQKPNGVRAQVQCKRNYSEISTDIEESYGNKHNYGHKKMSDPMAGNAPKNTKSHFKIVVKPVLDHQYTYNEVYNMSMLDLGLKIDPQVRQTQLESRLMGMNYSTGQNTKDTILVVPCLPSMLHSSNL
jgi:hypothetical protein